VEAEEDGWDFTAVWAAILPETAEGSGSVTTKSTGSVGLVTASAVAETVEIWEIDMLE